MTKETLAEKMAQLEQEQAHWQQQMNVSNANYHRVSGAIAFTKGLIAELEKPAEEPKK